MEINGIGYDDFIPQKLSRHIGDTLITERSAFGVSCCRTLFHTQKAAASHIAWSIILEKYALGNSLSSVKHLRGLECGCMRYEGETFTDAHGCPLHDRKTGYFKRLHSRLTRIIINMDNKRIVHF